MKVFFTPEARESLNDIAAYMRRFSPVAATRFRRRVVLRTRWLRDNPDSGRMVPEYQLRSVRELLEGDYRIWYRRRDDRLEILAVLHGARQILDEPSDQP